MEKSADDGRLIFLFEVSNFYVTNVSVCDIIPWLLQMNKYKKPAIPVNTVDSGFSVLSDFHGVFLLFCGG